MKGWSKFRKQLHKVKYMVWFLQTASTELIFMSFTNLLKNPRTSWLSISWLDYRYNVVDYLTSDLNVGGTAMMRKFEWLNEVALLTNKPTEVVDVRHVVAERNDPDAHWIVVDVKTDRQSARKVHDQLVLRLNATWQVENQHDVQYWRTACRRTSTSLSIYSWPSVH